MPRYVILEHDYPCLHWDLMMDVGKSLRTWRLAQLPEPGTIIPATDIFGHRRIYLDYEGPVSGNRGQVRRWDAGTYMVVSETADEVLVELTGTRLSGRAHIRRRSGDEWEFQYQS